VKSKVMIQPFATKKIMADNSNEEVTGSRQTQQLTKKYGRLKTELNNAYMWLKKNYPKTVESAVTMLSHYMIDKGVHITDEDKGQTDQKSFMQKHKNVTCYKCGKKGHHANKCPNGDSNDNESSTRSNLSLLSNRSNHSTRQNRMGWSG
jgi:hypothetical protein